MKIWRGYEPLLMKGEWHVHTLYTDGVDTVMELCKTANDLHIPLIAFTEHVRRDLDYDFWDLMEDIEKARNEFDMIILSGCEAKVLPGGDLDVDEDILVHVDYPIFAFHSFPPNVDEYLLSLRSAIRNRFVNAWAHPGLFLTWSGESLSKDEVRDVFRLMIEKDVLLELNSKYSLPTAEWLEWAREMGVRLVRGGDIHTMDAFRPYSDDQFRS